MWCFIHPLSLASLYAKTTGRHINHYCSCLSIFCTTWNFLFNPDFFFLRRQRKYKMEKEEMRNRFEQTLLKTQLEIQEHTFNYISQEIHDNIGRFLVWLGLT